MTFTKAEVLYLTSGDANAAFVGSVTWSSVNGFWRGEVLVRADGFPLGAIRLILNISVPNEPSFILTIRGRHCWRLDVNAPHKDLPGTHLQETDARGRELNAIDAEGKFPPIPTAGSVGGEQYGATFLAFAAHLGIEPSTLDWIDPPEGSPL